MIKKLALVLALLIFSSPAYAQKDHPIYKTKLVKPEYCKNIYDLLGNELFYLDGHIIGNYNYKQRDARLIRVAHLSTIYKNLCKNYKI